MIPLTMANVGDRLLVKKIGGKTEVRKHLENLGFVPGSTISVVNDLNGSFIINVKEARVAISKEMASKIMV